MALLIIAMAIFAFTSSVQSIITLLLKLSSLAAFSSVTKSSISRTMHSGLIVLMRSAIALTFALPKLSSSA